MSRVKWIVVVLWCIFSAPVEWIAKESVKTMCPRQRKKLLGLMVVLAWLVFSVVNGENWRSLVTDLAINYLVILLTD